MMEGLPVLTLADFADDTATATVVYRKWTIEFTFRPGLYTSDLLAREGRLSAIVAACVTEWNIDVPLVGAEIEKLPAGLVSVVFGEVQRLSTLADLPEVSAKSPTG